VLLNFVQGNASTWQHTTSQKQDAGQTRLHAHLVRNNVYCAFRASLQAANDGKHLVSLCVANYVMKCQVSLQALRPSSLHRCSCCWLMQMIRCKLVIVDNASLFGLRTGLHFLISRTSDGSKLIFKAVQRIVANLSVQRYISHDDDMLQYVAESSTDHAVNSEALVALLSSCAPATWGALEQDSRLAKQ
jgi:hypothetical protein